MDTKVKALCVKATDYGENDTLLTLVTVDCGKLTAKIRGAKTPKSKLKMAASPLCFGEYILAKKGASYTVIGASIEENFFAAWSDLHKYAAASVITEILDKISFGIIECGGELFGALKALSEVCYGNCSPYMTALWYGVNVLPRIGCDYTDESLPESVKALFTALENVQAEGADCIEATGSGLYEGLKYLGLLLKNTLSQKINSIEEALKLIR